MHRRTTAFIFTSLAYLIIMVHAVVPHHHHGESISIPFSYCTGHSHSHQASTSQHDHEDACLLTSLLLLPAHDNKAGESLPHDTANCAVIYHHTALESILSSEESFPLGEIPSPVSPSCVSAANILRAPPVA